MDAANLALYLDTCVPDYVSKDTMAIIVKQESAENPFAIGVVDGRLARQPKNLAEAIVTAENLEATGWNYSVGLGQINKKNFQAYGLTLETAFEPCANIRVGSEILYSCYVRAKNQKMGDQEALRAAMSCYYSNNFETGFRHGYVQKVLSHAGIKE